MRVWLFPTTTRAISSADARPLCNFSSTQSTPTPRPLARVMLKPCSKLITINYRAWGFMPAFARLRLQNQADRVGCKLHQLISTIPALLIHGSLPRECSDYY